MSTSTDLKNERNYILRKVSKNKGVLNVNIPLSIVRRSGIKPSDYVMVTYEDRTNKISFTKLNMEELV